MWEFLTKRSIRQTHQCASFFPHIETKQQYKICIAPHRFLICKSVLGQNFDNPDLLRRYSKFWSICAITWQQGLDSLYHWESDVANKQMRHLGEWRDKVCRVLMPDNSEENSDGWKLGTQRRCTVKQKIGQIDDTVTVSRRIFWRINKNFFFGIFVYKNRRIAVFVWIIFQLLEICKKKKYFLK